MTLTSPQNNFSLASLTSMATNLQDTQKDSHSHFQVQSSLTLMLFFYIFNLPSHVPVDTDILRAPRFEC